MPPTSGGAPSGVRPPDKDGRCNVLPAQRLWSYGACNAYGANREEAMVRQR